MIGARVWDEPDGRHIDVRGLPAPLPLTSILHQVREAAPGSVLIVHHDRDPLLLYPELVEIGWWADRIPGAPGEVRLRLAAAP